jgi:hypothetical protein
LRLEPEHDRVVDDFHDSDGCGIGGKRELELTAEAEHFNEQGERADPRPAHAKDVKLV